jgi:hypothetical protein
MRRLSLSISDMPDAATILVDKVCDLRSMAQSCGEDKKVPFESREV